MGQNNYFEPLQWLPTFKVFNSSSWSHDGNSKDKPLVSQLPQTWTLCKTVQVTTQMSRVQETPSLPSSHWLYYLISNISNSIKSLDSCAPNTASGLKFNTLLMTYQVSVTSSSGLSITACDLLTSGLSTSFVFEHLARVLHLPHSQQVTRVFRNSQFLTF